MKKKSVAALLPLLTCVLVLAGLAPAWAQEAPAAAAGRDEVAGQPGEPIAADVVSQATVSELMDREARVPVGALRRVDPMPLPSRLAKRQAAAPSLLAATATDPSAFLLPFAPQLPGTNFLATDLNEAGFVPAQPSGAVSNTQILVAAAGRLKVFDKNGVVGVLNVSTTTFFGTVTSDVHVRFDRLSQRWFMAAVDQVATTCPNHVLVAVSSKAVIDATTTFTIFTITTQVNRADFLPSLGVDRNAVYIGTLTLQDPTFPAPCNPSANLQSSALVLNKASLFTTTPAGSVFRNIIGGAAGMFAPQGVDNDDPASTQGLFVGVDFFQFGRLILRRVTTPGGTPALVANQILTVSTTAFPLEQVQPAPGPNLDPTDDRLFAAAIRRNKIGGLTTLWTAHNIGVINTCAGGTPTVPETRNGARWYEIQNFTGTGTLGVRQSGTLCDTGAINPFGYIFPGVTSSGQGHMALGATRAGADAALGFASVIGAGRLRTDTLGATQAATVLLQSTFPYDTTFDAPEPWGSYSQTVVDPADDQSMWTFQEYASAANTWGLRVTRLLAPLPALPSIAAPAIVFEGQPSLTVTLTGVSASGTEFFDPGADTGGPGYPNHVSSSITGGVTVNSTTFNSITQLTLNISTVGATPGAQNVTVTNPDGQASTGAGVLTVLACPAVTFDPPTAPPATLFSPYAQVFSQSGGVAPVTFGFTGTLPLGMTFNTATATLSGTPTQRGSFNFTLTTIDTNNCHGTRDYTLVVNCQTITVDPPTIPAATAGTAYTQQFTQTGAFGTVTWSLTGTLPTGMSFDTATGVLSGTPLQTGSFPITVTATDGNTCGGSQAYTLVVNCQTITVSPGTIPNATAGTAYSQAFTQTGGIGTVTWSLTGTLPTGLSFDTATGVLSGTPLQTGSFPLTVTASDGNTCTGSVSVTLTVVCQTITVSPGTIPAATAGSSYTQAFAQTSGIGQITWSLTGTLPAGMSFDTATGVLSGTPLQTGSFPLTVTATDGNNCAGSVSVTLVVNCQTITVSPGTIPAATAGSSYSQAFTQTSGIGTVTWSVTGTLPTGMSLDTATGVLSGTPLQTGSFPLTVTATDGNNCAGSVSVTLVVNCQAIGVSPTTIPGGQPNTPYSQFFTQTNGIGTVTWSEAGALPSGFTLNAATGELSGTTTDIGSFPITVTATDGNLCTGARAYNLTIGCSIISVDPTTIPAGTAGVAYTQTFTQTGGSGTVTFALTGTLPNGLTFDVATATLSGTPTQTGSFPITVSVTDGIGCPGSRNYTLVINCATVTVNPATIPAATAGTAYTQTFTQTGGLGTVTWSLTGALPTGLTFDTATGVLSGTPTQIGSFPITVAASDGNACTGGRDYTLLVNRAAPFASTTLAADTGGNGVFEAGEIAVVAPTWRNDTGAPDIVTGTASNFTGPVAASFGGTTYIITDPVADYGAVAAGATASCSGTGNCYGFQVSTPRPTLHWDGTFTETLSNGDARQWTLHVGDSFDDVLRSNQYYRFVETLLHRGVTGGCGASLYCPNDSSRREQMAVFVLVAKEGPGYTPAACTTPIFSDVPANSPYCPYIEELSRRNVISGCGNGKFCPLDPVTREQMAIFALRTLDPALDPPACTTPVFNDVPASSPYCKWIEELARRNIVAGCGGGAYCPASPVSRDQMSVFISATFGLTLYGQ